MEFRVAAQSQNYLGCLGQPLEECGCCCGLSLKAGILIITILDMVSGVLGTLGLLAFFAMPMTDVDESMKMTGRDLFDALIQMIMGALAIFCLVGLYKQKIQWIHMFYIAKLVLIPVYIIYTIANIVVFGEEFEADERFSLVLGTLICIAIILYEGKVIWSTVQRLENNEFALVMQGKGVLSNQLPANVVVQPQLYADAGQRVV